MDNEKNVHGASINTWAHGVSAFRALWCDILKKRFHVLHINIFSATSCQTWSGEYLETHWCVRWSRDEPDTICLRIYGNIAILPIENREIGDNSANTKANRIGFIAHSNNETGAHFLFTASRLTACCRKYVDMQIVKPFFQNIAPQRSECRYTMCSGINRCLMNVFSFSTRLLAI